jgi:hypothetical protein
MCEGIVDVLFEVANVQVLDVFILLHNIHLLDAQHMRLLS